MTSSKRIGVLELRSVRGTGGGPEKTILLGAARADRDHIAVTVCYIRDLRDTVFGIDDRARTLDIDYVEVREKHSFDPGIWRQLKDIIGSRGINIVHSHEPKTDLLALLLGWRTGIIPLATAHGWTGNSPREGRLYYPMDKRLLARFPRLIAVSTDIKQELVRHGADADRVTVILNAIDGAMFKRERAHDPVARAALGLERSWTVIGAIGRLERQKRFDLMLEAALPLLRERPDLHLVIAGDGSLRADLARQTEALGLTPQCHWLGHRTDVAELHHAFDVFVQASEDEGTPNSVLEAMAMETPIVATDVGGTRELALPGVHGLIVPPHDVPALRGAMVEVLADPEAAGVRARAARNRIEHELSFETRTRRLEAIYRDLVPHA